MGVEHLGPDHEVGDAELIFECDEHHARSRARSLAHQDETHQGLELAILFPKVPRGRLRRRLLELVRAMGDPSGVVDLDKDPYD